MKALRVFPISVKTAFKVSLRRLYALPFLMRKDLLNGNVKKSVKMRLQGQYASFTWSLRVRKFKVSCCGSTLSELTSLNSLNSLLAIHISATFFHSFLDIYLVWKKTSTISSSYRTTLRLLLPSLGRSQ